MVFLRQTWTLTKKNLLIAFNRHITSALIVAFILPVGIIIFLSYARNLFIPPSNFGIGTATPVRTLADGLGAATGGRDKVAFVNNGLSGGDIDRVIDNLAGQVDAAGKRSFRLDTEAELLDVCRSTLRGATTCYGAVVFDSSPSEGEWGLWNYTLRADGAFGTKIDTGKTNNEVEIYLLPLQRAVDTAIVKLNTSANALPSTVSEYPYTSMTQEQRNIDIRVRYQGAIINVIGIAFLIGLVDVTYHLTGFIAAERELGMSQLIEAMMPNLQRWQPQYARFLSYHIAFDIMYVPGWVIIGAVLGVGVFAKTSIGVLIITHLLIGLALASFSIFAASFFKKAQLSGISCCLVTIILGVVAQVIGKSGTGTVAILSFLFPSCNYVFFIILMARYERKELATNLIKAAPENPSTLPGIAFWVFFIIQILVYPVLGALVERSLYGTTSKGRSVSRGIESSDTSIMETVHLENFSKHYRPNWFRRKFSGITGTPKATVIAVNGLTLSAKKGQIYVLLGANGSGKSTTLEAVAGLNSVTSGSIKVDGTGGLGITPQKNVLWGDLTVEEHIRIFNQLKSTGKYDSKDANRQLVHAIDMDRKISAKAKTLSGGQKRKLQLGMMFTGGSAVCCVDEVSSGLDPLSRRKIWDILLAERGTRTIILTTHFLDEADLLADQIAILSKGTLRAQGSSVELKDKLGGGYRIHLSTGPGSRPAPHIDGIPEHVTFGQTIYSAADSRRAAQVIRRFDTDGMSDYQLSGPTIEDVFLQLADEIRAESEASLHHTPSPDNTKEKGPSTQITAVEVDSNRDLNLHSGQPIGFFRQAWVLFRKRITILRRNYLPYTAALLLPIIGAGLVTLFVKDQEPASCSPDGTINFSDIDTLASQRFYNLLVGPSSQFTIEKAIALFTPLLPPGLTAMVTPEALGQFVHLVDTLPEFNEFIDRNFSTVIPAGVWLGDENSEPTFAYKGNSQYLYSGVFGQNIMNVMLSNISIGTQFASFDIPWVADTGKSLQLTTYFGLVMAAYPAFFTLYPTVERMRKIRGLEYSNGVRSLPLWLAYTAFDFVPVLISSALSVGIFAAVSSVWYHVEYLFLIFILFGIASMLLSYVISLVAKTQLSAYAFSAAGQAVMFLVYIIAYLCTLTYAPVNKIDSDLLLVHFVISAFTPMGSLVRSLFLALNLFSTTCDGKKLASNPGGILQYGGPILYLILQILFLFAILIWYDSGSVIAWYRRFRKPPPPPPTEEGIVSDEEVAEELARVSSSNDGLRVLNLTKSFGSLTAVENLTFGIKRGEVFALLGPNGAGKSTTISLIRSDIQPSKNGGNIFVENIEINQHRAEARSHFGVCPQFDAMDQMTVVEHLTFYARVRGVPDVDHNVREVVRAVGLEAFSSRMAAKLSGGNKRKLSLGIALVGNPTVLLLDEPSSGMDAAAKRVMWKTLAAVVPGRSLLLTTHSMEEADALADRAGIMAKRMLAMGTTDHLRKKHGGAHYVHLVLKSSPHTTDEETMQIKSWVLEKFDGANIEDKTYHGQIRFAVPIQIAETKKGGYIGDDEGCEDNSMPIQCEGGYGIGSIITLLEDHRDELGLEHYSVSPTTLDQVFLTIVQKHNVEEEGYSKPKADGWMKRLVRR